MENENTAKNTNATRAIETKNPLKIYKKCPGHMTEKIVKFLQFSHIQTMKQQNRGAKFQTSCVLKTTPCISTL